MDDIFCIFFTKHKPMKFLPSMGIKNPVGDFRFSATYTKRRNLRIVQTVRPYGYMIPEDEALLLKSVKWLGMKPTAMMWIEGDHLPQMMRMIQNNGVPDWDFIYSRLVPV